MALVRTSRANVNNFGSSVTTGSFTPNNNSLLVAVLSCLDIQGGIAGITPVVSGGSLTWTEQIPVKWAGLYYMAIWTAPVGTAAPMTVTGGATGIDEVILQVLDFTGYNTGSPIGALAAVSEQGSVSGAFSNSLTSAPASDSYVVAASASDSPSVYTTPGTGWTQIYTGASVDIVDEVEERTGSTSATVTWADTLTSAFSRGGVAAEIKAAAAGGPTGQPKVKRSGGVAAMALPGRSQVWAPAFQPAMRSRMPIGPSMPVRRAA